MLPHLVRHIDDAVAVDIAVAFIMESGSRLLLPHLKDLLQRGGKLRFIAGDYLDVTDPSALRHFLDLQGDVQRLVFETGRESFHLKSWVFHREDGHGLAIVGSSNISETALLKGIEWNYRACSSESDGWRDVINGFERLLTSPRVKPLEYDWIDAYRKPSIELSPSVSPRPRKSSNRLKDLIAFQSLSRLGRLQDGMTRPSNSSCVTCLRRGYSDSIPIGRLAEALRTPARAARPC